MKTLAKILLTLVCLMCIVTVFTACEGMDIGRLLGGETPTPTPDGTDECTHMWGDWKVYEDGYCEERILKRVCLLCDSFELRDGAESDHWWSEYETTRATCSEGGYDERICDLCGKTERKNETEPTGEHEYGWMESDSEYHYSYCKNCYGIMNQDKHYTDIDGYCYICGYDPNDVTYDITIWVSELYGVDNLFARQIDSFLRENPDVKLNYTIMRVAEPDAASMVIQDVTAAPDIYCFPQDQLNRLVLVDALAAPDSETAALLKNRNDASSVSAASVGDSIYAYPLTGDNGYYMYYDKSIITNPDSLEQIIADCEAAGKQFRMDLSNAWYISSFFFATGCESEWIMDENGSFTAVNDTFNSPEGLIAMKGMQKLTQSFCYDSNADMVDSNTAVWVTGLWNTYTAEEVFGNNLGATDLPSFTVDGESYHLGSFTGNKLMGVKPQTDPKKEEILHRLAEYLTNAECQLERYEQFQWGPSNLEAQQSESVQSNPHLAALAKQNQYAKPQGLIHDSWWYIAKLIGEESRYAFSDSDLQKILSEYEKMIYELLNQ